MHEVGMAPTPAGWFVDLLLALDALDRDTTPTMTSGDPHPAPAIFQPGHSNHRAAGLSGNQILEGRAQMGRSGSKIA